MEPRVVSPSLLRTLEKDKRGPKKGNFQLICIRALLLNGCVEREDRSLQPLKKQNRD